MMPVASILVYVVPSLPASQPATKGVHVEFKLNAEMSRLNSVLSAPSSRVNLDLIGPRIYEALRIDKNPIWRYGIR